MGAVRILRIGNLALVGALLAGCGALSGGNGVNAPANPAGRPATVVTVAPVTSGPIAQVVQYTGTVQPAESVNVVPQIAGQIIRINVDVGSRVKAGDVIAELDRSTLAAQVAQAEAGVAAAQIKLQQIEAGGRPETVAQARANLDAAKAKLAAIQAGARPETVAQAKANLDAARAKLAALQAGSRAETIAQAKANLDAAQAKLQQLLNGPTPDQIAAAKLQVEQARDALAGVQANRDGQCNPRNPSYVCEAANAQVFAAETALNVANQNLKTLTDPPTAEQIRQAQAAVDVAEQQYKLALAPYTSNDLAQAQAAVDVAEQQYKLAQSPYTSNDLAQAQAAVDAAAAQLQLAQKPYTELDVKAAEVALQQAQAVLQIARTNLKAADIVAPFDGVVSARLLSPGALANPSTPIVTLISATSQVQFAIEEARIGSITTGQTVNLTSSAFPGKLFPGKVTIISPSADPKTHTFSVVVQPQDPSGALRAGMFVNLAITIASVPNAILVPNAAVVQRGSQSVVFVIANNLAYLQPVTPGISDDQHTQILQGVSIGQQVATIGQANLNDGSPVRIAGQSAGQPAQSGGLGRPAGAGANRSGNGSRSVGPTGSGASRPPSAASPTPMPSG